MDGAESQTSRSTRSSRRRTQARTQQALAAASACQDEVESQTSHTPSTYFTADSEGDVTGPLAEQLSVWRGMQLEKIFRSLAGETKRMREKELLRYAELCSFEGLRVLGAAAAESANGVYVPAGTEYNGKALFRKRGGSSMWFRYVLSKHRHNWMVSSTADKDANKDRGVLFSHEKNLSDPTKARRWSVWTGSRWEVQESISVSHQSRTSDWAQEYTALCKERGFDASAGLGLAEFLELVSDPGSRGYTSNEDLHEALLRQQLPPVVEDGASVSRLSWIYELFKLLDAKQAGRLDEKGLKHYAELCGFEGDAADWKEEYQSQCSRYAWDPKAGVDVTQFAHLVNDEDGEGYCTEAELLNLLSYVRQQKGDAAFCA